MILVNKDAIKAIIFDFDGVIFDSEPIHWQACNVVFKQIGFTISYERYLEKYIGLSDREMFPLILQDEGYTQHLSEINNLIFQKIKTYKNVIRTSSDLKGIDGLIQFLEYAKPILPHFAICSGATRDEIETTLSNIEQGLLQPYFKLITTCEDVMKGKPSPEGYLKTAQALKLEPENCLVIEDTQKGILAAKAAKMKVIGIATTNKKDALKDADFVAASYAEIMSIV